MFVFVYSSYHLNFPFSHLVVILTTLEAPKNIFCFNNNIMNDNSKQDHPTELSGRATRALPRIFRLFWIPKNKIPTWIKPPKKKTCQIFLPHKL